MTLELSCHPFDEAVRLQLQADGSFLGHTHPSWANMVGPFGGITAATVVQAIVDHPQCLGAPVAVTLNYLSGIADGAFSLRLRIARTNRSTQHWMFEIVQTAADGSTDCVLTGTAMTAARRETWGVNDMPMPAVPAAHSLPDNLAKVGMKWFGIYDMRVVIGAVPTEWDGSENPASPEQASLTQLWVRDRAGRALDFAALTASADIFAPRIWTRRSKWTPAGTVSMTVYFHADQAQLAAVGSGYVLAQARGQVFRNGFFDQSACLWSEAGVPLATTHQLVYFKD